MGTSTARHSKWALALAATMGATVVATGCTSTDASPSQTSAAPSSPAVVQTPTAAPSAEAISPAPVDFSALPEGVLPGTDAAVAWEALMGPDGEYAAAASYAAVIDAFGDVEPYVTIKSDEERHIEALIRQLERYGVAVPDNPYLGQLSAPAELQAAAQAWADGEILNVAMYDELLTQTSDPSLVRVLGNLRRASLESHLPTFEAAAAAGGVLTNEQLTAVRAG